MEINNNSSWMLDAISFDEKANFNQKISQKQIVETQRNAERNFLYRVMLYTTWLFGDLESLLSTPKFTFATSAFAFSLNKNDTFIGMINQNDISKTSAILMKS